MDILKLDNVNDVNTLNYLQKFNPFSFRDSLSNIFLNPSIWGLFFSVKNNLFSKTYFEPQVGKRKYELNLV
jgi:hypothetical protein